MAIYDWYGLFNYNEFLATALVSRSLVVVLEGRGRTTFNLFLGEELCVAYEDALIPVKSGAPNVFGTYAVYKDVANTVWFGFEVVP